MAQWVGVIAYARMRTWAQIPTPHKTAGHSCTHPYSSMEGWRQEGPISSLASQLSFWFPLKPSQRSKVGRTRGKYLTASTGLHVHVCTSQHPPPPCTYKVTNQFSANHVLNFGYSFSIDNTSNYPLYTIFLLIAKIPSILDELWSYNF